MAKALIIPTKDAVLAELRAMEPQLRAEGVAALYLFGSVARGDAEPHSDIDLFCDLDPDNVPGWSFYGIGPMIAERIGRKVDLTTRGSLHRLIRQAVEREALPVYG